MCGIAGWLDRATDLSERLSVIHEMSETLSRRGPDEHGTYVDKGVCLMHRRLTVIDPQNGKQPMTKKYGEKEYIIVYNGELYNTEDLRRELLLCGHNFEGHSDTEVLLTAFIEWGEECVSKLNGIFAFGIYQKHLNKLFLARDKMGVKPLFFYRYDGGFLFASEIKTLLKNPLVKHEVDEKGLYELLFVGPGRTSGQGVIKDVEELLPGECAVYDGYNLRRSKYFKLIAKEHEDNREQTIEKVRFLLKDAINRQLISDVPLCTFLSGGLDSSIISKVAADYFHDHNRPLLTTYSVDYVDNQKYFQKSLFQPNSDRDYIGLISGAIGSEHKEVILNNEELADALIDATDARDLPGMADVDSSLLLFCKEVKKDYTVVLSGECADEVFGGYPWYHNKEILFEECFPWSRTLDVRRSILKNGILPYGEEYVHEKYLDTIKQTDKLPHEDKFDSRMREMFMLNINWFMQTLLDRKDRMSMYNGLEVRVPFCDYRIVEYAFNMPWSLKALDGREKGIVRKAMENDLPYDIVWRKKSPYPKTHNPLYFKIVSERAMNILNDKKSLVSKLLSVEGVKAIIENPDGISAPWYGQLMRAPQILAYIIQLDHFFTKYKIKLV
ncbi:MAG: asparagine synthase (glutamine-hydrolyzing) [Bacillota bacterium]|nr:asparagine synthase (glutamine-hydrolyzing) [Bacillota bacterium]